MGIFKPNSSSTPRDFVLAATAVAAALLLYKRNPTGDQNDTRGQGLGGC